MKFDVTFLDVTAYKPYDGLTMATEPLGGTEASVIRIAEALAAFGLKVAVVEHVLQEPSTYNNVYYLPYEYLSQIDTHNFIILRGTHGLELFPKAKKFSWHHDVASAKLYEMRNKLLETETTVIAVSKWHKEQISRYLNDIENTDKVVLIKTAYNPVPDQLYDLPQVEINKNKLIWAASPHKGLDVAVALFKRLRAFLPTVELHVYNPGYFTTTLEQEPGVILYGAVACIQLWKSMHSALCVFYPTKFEETFGCIAAEANAIGTPVAGYRIAGLNESAEGQRGLLPPGDDVALLKQVEHWYNGYRPDVKGKEKFKTTEVVQKWLKWLQ